MLDQSVVNKNTQDDKLILVGVISAAHGIKGQVIIRSFTAPQSNIEKLPIINEQGESLKIKIVKVKPSGMLICNIGNCSSRTEAERLVRSSIFCLRSNLPKISTEDEFYIEDLKGLKVLDNMGAHIGNITNIANYGAGDIIEIEFINDKKIEMFPFTKELFPTIAKDHVVLNSNYLE